MTLKITNNTGPKIPVKLRILTTKTISLILTDIFNKSLINGILALRLLQVKHNPSCIPNDRRYHTFFKEMHVQTCI